MAKKKKAAKAGAGAIAAGKAARDNPYVQRIVEDEDLRGTKRRKRGKGRLLLLLLVGGAVAIALSEDLRKKVLDALFGAEEEFEYTSTTTPSSGQQTPVGTA